MIKRKPPAEQPSNRAAEDDARNMLLAGGIAPVPDKSALQQIIDGIARIDAAVLTIEEFCEFMRISRATYYRMIHAGAGPRLTLIFGAVRIRKDDALSWLDDQPQIEPEPLPANQSRPRHLCAPKPAKKKATPKKANVPRLFEPAPPKPGRRKKDLIGETADKEN